MQYWFCTIVAYFWRFFKENFRTFERKNDSHFHLMRVVFSLLPHDPDRLCLHLCFYAKRQDDPDGMALT